MPYYTRTYNPQPTTRVASTVLKDEFQLLESALDAVEVDVGKGIRAPEATTALPNAASRANKVLSFDVSGNPAVPIAVADLAAAVTAASNAATSETNAAASATAADASADAAAISEANAAASAASIAGGPVASVNGMTGVVTGIATQTGAETLTNKTIAGAVFNDGYTEEVFAVTGTTPALSPTNGSIQTWTLSGASTPTYGTWAAGQSIVLMITAGANTITWPTTTWSKVGGGGAAPTLTSSGATCVILWKVGTTTYGALLGSV